MTDSIRVVVVGAGGISNAWFGPLQAEQVEVAALVDLRLEAAQSQIDKHRLSARAFTDLGEALAYARPDFVLDLTIPAAHCDVTCAALQAGYHVLGEKPMAADMQQAGRMLAASENSGKLYMVSQSRRWEAHHQQLRDTLRSGEIGSVTTINCDFYIGAHFGGFRDEMPSPLVLDMAIHQFDLARYFTGADPLYVYAHEHNPAGSWYKGDAAATCVFELSNGIVFNFRGSWCAEGCHTSWNGDWRIVGTRGTLLYEHDGEPHGQVVTNDAGFHREHRAATIAPATLEHPTMRGALREMLRFLRTGEKPQTECRDNIKSLAMVFAAMQSAREHARLAVSH